MIVEVSQRSKVKVTAGRRGGEGIHIDTGAAKRIFWFSNVLLFSQR